MEHLTGTYYVKRLGKWVSSARHDGKQVHIGVFDTAEEAHAAFISFRSANPLQKRVYPTKVRKEEATIELMLKLFDYDKDTGVLRWKVDWRKAKAGDVAGYMGASGYIQVSVNNARLIVHRIILAMVNMRWPPEFVDHINGDTRDNRLCNLREATKTENSYNKKTLSNKACKHKGVHKYKEKYVASITKENKSHHLGVFNTEDEAGDAYRAAAAKFFGEWARKE